MQMNPNQDYILRLILRLFKMRISHEIIANASTYLLFLSRAAKIHPSGQKIYPAGWIFCPAGRESRPSGKMSRPTGRESRPARDC
jgi:hypothetical protein